MHRLASTDTPRSSTQSVRLLRHLPHAELMRSVSRRVSDRHLSSLLKQWLVAAVEEDDHRGHRIRTTRAKDEIRSSQFEAPDGTPKRASAGLHTWRDLTATHRRARCRSGRSSAGRAGWRNRSLAAGPSGLPRRADRRGRRVSPLVIGLADSVPLPLAALVLRDEGVGVPATEPDSILQSVLFPSAPNLWARAHGPVTFVAAPTLDTTPAADVPRRRRGRRTGIGT